MSETTLTDALKGGLAAMGILLAVVLVASLVAIYLALPVGAVLWAFGVISMQEMVVVLVVWAIVINFIGLGGGND